MAGRIVLFGATGYTGELTARELAGMGERPVLAARDGARVSALADELGGLEWAVADVSGVGGTASVRALVERGDVLVSCVGPFQRWGAPAVEAAIDAGAHYLDSTGETPFIRRVFEHWGPRAAAADCVLLTAMGYDWVPGNLAAALALTDAGPEGATRVAVGYFLTGAAGMSGGTRASAAGVFLEPSFAWRGGRIVAERPGARGRSFLVDGRSRKAISAGSSEHFGLPPSFPGLREVDVYLGWFGAASDALRAAALGLSVATRVPLVRDVLGAVVGRAVKGSTGGPDADARAASGSVVVAEATDRAGHVVGRAHLAGVNGYDFTAGMLAWGARAAAAGRLHGSGALGPVAAYGVGPLAEGARSAGIERIS
jgi:short subunit dehydrogenase-like uncharacterized protein